MLETIRQYATEVLEGAGGNEAQSTHERHALYFVDLAEQAESELRGPHQIAWFKLLEKEHDNIRAALKWLLEHMHTDVAGKLGAALWRFWHIYGHANEGRQWLEATLQKEAIGDASIEADVLNALGVLNRHLGDYSSAASFHRQSLALSRDMQDARRIARALTNLSNVIRYEGQYQNVEQLLEESLTISRELGDKENLASTLNILGITARHMGEPGRAATLCEQSLALYREIGNKVGIADALSNLGTIAHALGDYRQAGTYFAESLTIFREVGNKPGQSVALTNLGFDALHAHDYTAAAAFYRESLSIRREIGNNSGIAYGLNDLGSVEQKQGDNEKAERHYAESLLLFSRASDSRGIAECLERVAGVAAARMESRWAAQLLGAAEALRNATGTQIEPEDKADYESNVKLVRKQLGEEIVTAWQEGQMLPVEGFITQILGKYDDISGQLDKINFSSSFGSS
jgi:tetratricopeptide (TPR) repeat protein